MISVFREWFYRRRILKAIELPGLVISVGNITLGGTGKSPMVLWLAEWALKNGISAGVLSRGYKRRHKGLRVIQPWQELPEVDEIGDEPWMIRHRIPGISLLVHKDRARMALRHWIEFGSPKIVLLDDGFQHWRVRRDFDVVMIDATEALDQRTLPFGRAREKISALARADLIVITRAEQVGVDQLERIQKRIRKSLLIRAKPVWKKRAVAHPLIVAADYRLDYCFDAKSEQIIEKPNENREFLLLSGIAKPEGFRSLAKKHGFRVREEMYFPDHHMLSSSEVNHVKRALSGLQDGAVLVNEKDWSRWRSLFQEVPGVVVRVQFHFLEGEKAMAPFLEEVRQHCST